MRIGKIVLVIAVVSLLFALGCGNKTVRFTDDEIMGFPPEVRTMIANGEVALGMTPQMVRYSWGAPDSVRVLSSFEGKSREEWNYTKVFGAYEEKKVLFLGGKVSYIIPEPATAADIDKTGQQPPQRQQQAPAVAPQQGQVKEPIPLQGSDSK